MLNLQDVLLKLTAYWVDRGAMVVQPFNTEVGAGTANPATTLRVLGPEPWRAAYVEPSVRPDDARYGLNPNRLQTHTQFQVILKPDPGDPQEQYLASLEAIGVDLKAHDIRFVEDNWASPALGAWGLGWEVWLDGLEITQFTYFQQAGSLTLDPVSVEITYGIERIVMALQNVSHFKDIAYAPGISYGEAFGQAEYEMSRYFLDDADIEVNRKLYDLHAAEAQQMIDAELAMPAYYNVLKCSHVFNVLDARGVISTTERARAFNLMRKLSRGVAELWVRNRGELGFPLGTLPKPEAPTPLPMPEVTEPSTLLFEIGVEELPVGEVDRALTWLRTTLAQRLAATGLAHGTVTAYATPRRLIAMVDQVAPREADAVETVRGPRVSAAFDAEGAPTRAATGFAGKNGVDPAALDRTVADGVEYVAVVRQVVGRPAAEVLSALLGQLTLDLRSERNMRWADPKLAYSRPIRWLLAKLGTATVPVTASQLTSGSTTRVQRLADAPVVEVPSADGYLEFLAAHDVVADGAQRREIVLAAATELATAAGGRVDLETDAALVAEIVNLVESPVPVLGDFGAQYLELPPEILINVMRKHQRYLPVRGEDGLLPHFVTFANGACDVPTVKAGNEAVLRARFEDALFFWRADSEQPLSTFQEGLGKLAFERTLGSVAERATRIGAIARSLADVLALPADQRSVVDRAAALAKFDLGTQMVIEMTSLAGTMARYYALGAGEPEPVARALEDMEKPRTSDGAVASALPGAVLAIADRADLLAGLFAVGEQPTGSSDPFALRRAALGLLATMRAYPELADLGVDQVLQLAAAPLVAQGIAVPAETQDAAATFVHGRFEQSLLDAGGPLDAVSAVVPLAGRPAAAAAVLAEIEELAADPELANLVEAVQRIRRLIKDGQPSLDRDLLPEDVAVALITALQATTPHPDLRGTVRSSTALVAAVHDYLEDTLVMADDPAVRAARVGLLASVLAVLAPLPLDWDALGRFVQRREA
jgi:glycyl-tRNA synthetase